MLAALDGLDGLAPRLLASGAEGGPAGRPWTLISRLPGKADITSGQPSAVAAQLGRALARIHATPPRRLTGLPSVFGRPGESLAALTGPAADVVAGGWSRFADVPAVLTHYDFWSGNVVWQGGVLTGVVDWAGAAVGPPGFDVGWCRLDLWLLYGEHAADAFLRCYQAARAAALPEPLLCDLWAVARSHRDVGTWAQNYRDLGRPDLTAGELRRRHAARTERLRAGRPMSPER